MGRNLGQTMGESLYRYDGSSWTKVLEADGSLEASPAAIYAVGTDEVFACFDRNVWRSRNRGMTWESQTNVLMPDGYFAQQITGNLDDIHLLIYGS